MIKVALAYVSRFSGSYSSRSATWCHAGENQYPSSGGFKRPYIPFNHFKPLKKNHAVLHVFFHDFAPKNHRPNWMAAPPAPRDPPRASQRNPRSHGAADGAEAAKDNACGAERMESAPRAETPAPGKREWHLLKPIVTSKLDDGWPESVEEQSLLLLVWRHYIARQYIKDVL